MKDAIGLFNLENKKLTRRQRGLPDVVYNPYTSNKFSKEIMHINKGFELYGKEIYELDKEIDDGLPKISLGGGGSGKFKPFPLGIDFMKRSFKEYDYSECPLAAGDPKYRKMIYLKEGLVLNIFMIQELSINQI